MLHAWTALFLLAAETIHVAPDIQQAQLIYQVRPVYPKLALEARIQGTVRLRAEISKRGAVENIRLVSGHPLLVKAAMDAVRRWRYRPTYSLGRPVRVRTAIDVNFSLYFDPGARVVSV